VSAAQPDRTLAPKRVLAAGGVITRVDGEADRTFGVVHRPRHGDWSLPKGKLEPGESLEQCALREVAEETGLVCELGVFLGTTSYTDSRLRPKTVWWWAMEPKSGSFVPGDEVDELVWLTAAAAGERLSYERDRELLEKFAATLG
jgi:8-oxo-dGTP pyrophosphatase MutT (NUDIX family)